MDGGGRWRHGTLIERARLGLGGSKRGKVEWELEREEAWLSDL